jgi:hypothetical protein
MSSIAFLNTPTCSVLLSDGIAIEAEALDPSKPILYSEIKDKIVSFNYKKVFKINTHVGVLWMGAHAQAQQRITSYCNNHSIGYPKRVAEAISEMLKDEIPAHLRSKKWFNINVHVIGYEKDGQLVGSGVSHSDFRTDYAILGKGELGCSIPQTSMNETKWVFANELVAARKQSDSPQKVARTAFKNVISHYKAKDKLIGGELFIETIAPRRLAE